MGKTPGGGGWPKGGIAGILRGGGGSVIGGLGRPVGGMTGGGGNGIMLGRLTSSTMSGSFPWSNGQRSPRTQNPFSVWDREMKQNKNNNNNNNESHTYSKINIRSVPR